MTTTILTASITVGSQTVPLTKAIVRQLAHFQPNGLTREQVSGIGTVDLGDEYAYLIQTPAGLTRSSCSIRGLTEDTRIMLLK